MRRRAEALEPASRLEVLIREGRREKALFDQAGAGEISQDECWAQVFDLRRSIGFPVDIDDFVDVVAAEEALDPMPDPREAEHAAP